jgi:hypothetical protein
LASTHQELASQWDHERNGSLRPVDVTAGSRRKVSWRCAEGHAWDAVIHARSAGHGCPYCCGKLPIVGESDLATVNPELAEQAIGWDPNTVTPSSGLKRRWRCSQGHEWTATVANRAQGSGCPGCSKYH